MRPLSTYQRVLSWLCVGPTEEAINKWNILFTLCIFCANITGLLVSLDFFLKYLSIDLEQSLFAIFQISATISTFYVSLIVFFSKHKIIRLFQSLAGIYNEYASHDSFKFLVQVNGKSNWIWQMYLKFAVIGWSLCAVGMSLISILMGFIITKNVYSKYLYRPYKIILPWNQHTLNGYIGDMCIDIMLGDYGYLFSNGLPLLLFISICCHHRAFSKIFRHSVSQLDTLHRSQHHTFLTNLIRSHISFKVLFLESADIFSLYVLVELICSAVILACAVFLLDLELRHISFDISILFVAFSVGSSNLFCWCFFGKLATENYEKMSNCLYDTNWQALSVKLQRYVVLMIRNAQVPLYYHGFGVTVLNLVTFTKMLRTVFTYYMMFKTITSD